MKADADELHNVMKADAGEPYEVIVDMLLWKEVAANHENTVTECAGATLLSMQQNTTTWR